MSRKTSLKASVPDFGDERRMTALFFMLQCRAMTLGRELLKSAERMC